VLENSFLKNEAGELLKTKEKPEKTNRKRSRNELGYVVEKKETA